MVQVKGSAITSRIRFVRERGGGEEPWLDVKRRLSPASRSRVEQGVLPHAWVPFSLFVELNEAADAVLGGGDLALCREMGSHGARVNLPTIYRIFLRFGSIPFILRKGSRLWDVHYDSGRLDVDIRKDEADLSIADFASPHRAHCLSVLGWAEGAGLLTGAKDIEARELGCRVKGDDACRFHIRWG